MSGPDPVTRRHGSRPPSQWPSRGALLLWPIAILTALHQTRDSLVTSTGGDFIPVWRAARAFLQGGEPYQVLGFVYPPSALMLLAPFGSLSFPHAHLVFHVINTAAVVTAAVLTLRLFRIPAASVAAPAIIFALFISAPLRLTLYTENVNGVVLMSEVIALLAALHGRWTWAGIAFGLGLAVKPVLLPLLVLPVLARQWRAVVTAIALPVALSALALPMLAGGSSYLTDVVPFLWKGNYSENYLINASIAGAVRILQLPSGLGSALRLATLATAAVLIWFRLRGGGDPRIVATHLVGLILSTTFLAFSFSWPYYALYLLPVFASFATPPAAFQVWRLLLAGAAAYLIASQDYFPRFGGVRITCGYFVLLAALAPERLGRPATGP